MMTSQIGSALACWVYDIVYDELFELLYKFFLVGGEWQGLTSFSFLMGVLLHYPHVLHSCVLPSLWCSSWLHYTLGCLTFATAVPLYPCRQPRGATSINYGNLSHIYRLSHFRAVTHRPPSQTLLRFTGFTLVQCEKVAVYLCLSRRPLRSVTSRISIQRFCCWVRVRSISRALSPFNNHLLSRWYWTAFMAASLWFSFSVGHKVVLLIFIVFMSEFEAKDWRNRWNSCFLSG